MFLLISAAFDIGYVALCPLLTPSKRGIWFDVLSRRWYHSLSHTSSLVMWKFSLGSLHVHLHFSVFVCSWHPTHHLFYLQYTLFTLTFASSSVAFSVPQCTFTFCIQCSFFPAYVCLPFCLIFLHHIAICVSPFISRLCLSFSPFPFLPVLISLWESLP